MKKYKVSLNWRFKLQSTLITWPGAFCILDRLRKYAKTPSYDSALNACFEKAIAENDYVWWNNLQMLKGESCLNLSNQ